MYKLKPSVNMKAQMSPSRVTAFVDNYITTGQANDALLSCNTIK